ncbi:translation initiation factor IF-2-like [Homo sapiens]|uniref:translation initiation factor IF-2-like n=1 Tax=Homo sapiens TaxID=9606 RepID=UPI0023DF1B57|nr:translation initiation factor IF-2-like [Homo sapiens]
MHVGTEYPGRASRRVRGNYTEGRAAASRYRPGTAGGAQAGAGRAAASWSPAGGRVSSHRSGIPPRGKKASEGHGGRSAQPQRLGEPGPGPAFGVGGARPPPGSRGPKSVFPSVCPSGRLARSSARGHGARNSKEAERWDWGSGLRWDGSRAAGSLPSGSAGHHRRSVRLGFLHYCFRPQQRRPPRAWPRPLPPAPSRKGCGEGGAAAGTPARSPGCCGSAPPLLHRRRTFASSSPVIPCFLAGVSYRSLERSSSHTPPRGHQDPRFSGLGTLRLAPGILPRLSGLWTQTELLHWLSWFSSLKMADRGTSQPP